MFPIRHATAENLISSYDMFYFNQFLKVKTADLQNWYYRKTIVIKKL